MDDLEATRQSWNIATRNHNSHKGDQAARLKAGEDILFPEELELLGDVQGKRLVHLQCNAGQDSLCLARRGARVTGIDMSDEAISFAKQLSTDSEIEADFVQSELIAWLQETDERFDIAFTSYGATGWLKDINAWAAGVHRIVKPGGCLVYVEFHPLVWSFGSNEPFGLTGTDYFDKTPFYEPVSDYVAESEEGLGAVDAAAPIENTVKAVSYQHGVADVLNAVAQAGLTLDEVHEWPYSNGCRLISGLVKGDDRRWQWPEGTAPVPLMYGFRAKRP